MVTEKECTKCGLMLPLDAYNNQALGKYGKRSYCRECQKIMCKDYRQSDSGRAIRNAWKKTEKGRACTARYESQDRVRAVKRENERKRKALQGRTVRAEGKDYTFLPGQDLRFGSNRESAMQRDGFKCRLCGDDYRLQVHHIDERGRNTPREQQNHELSNLITLCARCHIKQHNPVLKRWQKAKGGVRPCQSN